MTNSEPQQQQKQYTQQELANLNKSMHMLVTSGFDVLPFVPATNYLVQGSQNNFEAIIQYIQSNAGSTVVFKWDSEKYFVIRLKDCEDGYFDDKKLVKISRKPQVTGVIEHCYYFKIPYNISADYIENLKRGLGDICFNYTCICLPTSTVLSMTNTESRKKKVKPIHLTHTPELTNDYIVILKQLKLKLSNIATSNFEKIDMKNKLLKETQHYMSKRIMYNLVPQTAKVQDLLADDADKKYCADNKITKIGLTLSLLERRTLEVLMHIYSNSEATFKDMQENLPFCLTKKQLNKICKHVNGIDFYKFIKTCKSLSSKKFVLICKQKGNNVKFYKLTELFNFVENTEDSTCIIQFSEDFIKDMAKVKGVGSYYVPRENNHYKSCPVKNDYSAVFLDYCFSQRANKNTTITDNLSKLVDKIGVNKIISNKNSLQSAVKSLNSCFQVAREAGYITDCKEYRAENLKKENIGSIRTHIEIHSPASVVEEGDTFFADAVSEDVVVEVSKVEENIDIDATQTVEESHVEITEVKDVPVEKIKDEKIAGRSKRVSFNNSRKVA